MIQITPKRNIRIALMVVLVAISSCSKLPIEVTEKDQVVLSGSRFKLRLLTSLYKPYRIYKEYVNESISGLRFEYDSQIYGKAQTLSGIILIPHNRKEPMPLLVYCHGTMFDQSLAPSLWTSAVQLQALPSMDGYITFIPDYLGYGVSQDQVPSYFDQKETNRAIIDMVKAGLEFLEEHELKYKPELFLLGYSQGGHAALSLTKELQSNPLNGVELKATATIAGPFQLKENLDFILQKDTFHTSAYVSYLLSSMNFYYWKRDVEDFFQSPNSDSIRYYLNGDMSLNRMARAQTSVINNLMNPEFLNSYLGSGEVELKDHIYDNSDFDFVPQSPVMIIHSDSDETVPLDTSISTWEQMIKLGADSSTVKFHQLHGANHAESALVGIPVGLDFLRLYRSRRN